MSRREANGAARWRSFGEASLSRRGALLLEAAAAIGVLGVVMVVVVQTSLCGMRERARNAAHQAALELAHNVMETARAMLPQDLTPAWAAQQKLPGGAGEQLAEAKLTVTVEPEKSLPAAKRVTVDIRWGVEPIPGALKLVGVFSPRATVNPGGKR